MLAPAGWTKTKFVSCQPIHVIAPNDNGRLKNRFNDRSRALKLSIPLQR